MTIEEALALIEQDANTSANVTRCTDPLAPVRVIGAEIGRLRALLIQIAIVCEDNMPPTCDHAMALLFIRGLAAGGNQQSTQDSK